MKSITNKLFLLALATILTIQNFEVMAQIHGYTYGSQQLATSPVTMDDLALLKKTLLWSEDDDRYLRMAGEVLGDQVDDVLDLWYGYVGGNEHLLYYFTNKGEPQGPYLDAVRKRFGQWIHDLCNKPYDQDWLNYQYEIALRHHSTKKNKTDGVESVPIIHGRYLTTFIYPLTVTIKDFLGKKGHSEEDVNGMYNAWFKAVTLTAVLWTYPYYREGEF
ncbi:MAG: protoglobin domain-containing protein [Saprospiraceae bacterium]